MKTKQLDLNNLPKRISKWIRAYISPVVFKGKIPYAQVGEDKGYLQSIEVKEGHFLLHYKIECTSEVHVDHIDYEEFGLAKLREKDQFHCVSGDTISPTLSLLLVKE